MDNKDHTTSDHDLLIEVSTMIKYLTLQMEDMKKTISSQNDDKISKAEVVKMSADSDKIHSDHESRIRAMEKFQENAAGRNAIIAFLVVTIVSLITSALKLRI